MRLPKSTAVSVQANANTGASWGKRHTKRHIDHTIDLPVGKADPALFSDNKPDGSAQGPTLLTVQQTAEFLTVSVATVRRLQQGGRIPFHKIGGGVRFNARDLLAYLARQRVEPIGT